MFSPSHGIAVGEAGNIVRTKDGGTIWRTIQPLGSGQRLPRPSGNRGPGIRGLRLADWVARTPERRVGSWAARRAWMPEWQWRTARYCSLKFAKKRADRAGSTAP